MKFTAAEHARLSGEVERLGVASLADLIRQRSLSGRVKVIQQSELSAVDRIELNKLGVNLNQLVRHLNYHRGGSDAVASIADDAKEALRRINALLLRGLEV